MAGASPGGDALVHGPEQRLDRAQIFLDIPAEDADESPIDLILGGYSQGREWAPMENYLSEEDAQRTLSHNGGEWEFEGVDDWQLDDAMCACISIAADETEDLTITG